MTYHFLAMCGAPASLCCQASDGARETMTSVSPSGSINQVGDEPPESIEKGEKDRGERARRDHDDGRVGDLFLGWPADLGELGRDLTRPSANVGATVSVDGR